MNNHFIAIETLNPMIFQFIVAVRFQGYNQGAHPGEAGGNFRGGHVDRGGYHGHRPYGRPYVPRYSELDFSHFEI